jgi:hypothetical protein
MQPDFRLHDWQIVGFPVSQRQSLLIGVAFTFFSSTLPNFKAQAFIA